MGNKLLILGAGQYGSYVYGIAQRTASYDKIDFLDDFVTENTIGVFSDCDRLLDTYNSAIVAIGDADQRNYWLNHLSNIGYHIPVLIDPSAVISSSAIIGYGTIVEPLAVIQSNTFVGTGCLVCSGSVLKHNCTVGDYCYIDCNSTVMTETIVPAKTRVNANSVFFFRN